MLRKNINPHWEVVADFNYRFQNDYLRGGTNPFVFQQSNLHRLMINYRTSNDFLFQFSPFLYGEVFRLRFSNAQQTEVNPVRQREIRFTAGVQKLLRFRQLQFRPRLWYEQRQFLEVNPQSRFRFQLLFQYPVFKGGGEKNLALLAFNEIFYTVTQPKSPTFDQNRSFLGFYYQSGKVMEYQFGYQFIHQRQTQAILNRSNLLAYVILRL